MDRYLSAKQVMEALSCSRSEAYSIMNQVPCLQSPLRVSERVLKSWIEKNTRYPVVINRRAG